MNKCVCQGLNEGNPNKIITIAGDDETSLKIVKANNNYTLIAEDYNSISTPIKYCPFCGRKLGED